MTTTINATCSIPTRAEVSANNQGIFDSLQKGLGFVPRCCERAARTLRSVLLN